MLNISSLRILAFVVPLLTSLSCASGSWWTKGGLRHPDYHYRIMRQGAAYAELLPGDWDLTNFQQRDHGIPEPKDGDEYTTVVDLDSDGDGTHDFHASIRRYDARFQHRRSNGYIWVSSIPIDRTFALKDASVLVGDLAQTLSGGAATITINPNISVSITIRDKRFGVSEVSREDRTVDGRSAASITVDLVNLDNAGAGSDEATRVELVLLKTQFVWPPDDSSMAVTTWPVVLVLGYSNARKDFESSHPAFLDLLSRFRFPHTTDQ